jgi:hypothetical protein
MTLQVGKRVILTTRFEGEMTALLIPYQQTLAPQVPGDPFADPPY